MEIKDLKVGDEVYFEYWGGLARQAWKERQKEVIK